MRMLELMGGARHVHYYIDCEWHSSASVEYKQLRALTMIAVSLYFVKMLQNLQASIQRNNMLFSKK